METKITHLGDEGHEYPYIEVIGTGTYLRACRRCGGTGSYLHDGQTDACYRCGRIRHDPDSPLFASEKEALDDAIKRGRARAKRAAKRGREHEARIAKMKEKQQTAGMEYPDVYAYLAIVNDVLNFGRRDDSTEEQRRSADRVPMFIEDMVGQLFWPANCDREFTPRMVEAVRTYIERQNAEEAAKIPVPEGRLQVEGRVISTKYYEDQYGKQARMLVADDRGFKVYGSIPKSIQPHWDWDAAERDYVADGVLKGSRVRFEAQLTRSDDDESFGFFKRPTKAEIFNR